MKPTNRCVWLVVALISQLSCTLDVIAQDAPDDPALTTTIAALDTKLFNAYNTCNLSAFGDYFSPTVEFYHDKGGATFDRATVVSNTKKYICGKVHRELIVSSLHVYPIKDFGAIEEGEHRFCEIATGRCEGVAKFLIVWQNAAGSWQATRVLSFGHRPIVD